MARAPSATTGPPFTPRLRSFPMIPTSRSRRLPLTMPPQCKYYCGTCLLSKLIRFFIVVVTKIMANDCSKPKKLNLPLFLQEQLYRWGLLHIQLYVEFFATILFQILAGNLNNQLTTEVCYYNNEKFKVYYSILEECAQYSRTRIYFRNSIFELLSDVSIILFVKISISIEEYNQLEEAKS